MILVLGQGRKNTCQGQSLARPTIQRRFLWCRVLLYIPYYFVII
nr:MAG TPA: hypothetical protein [Caudoviricetes sp.]